MSGRKRLGGDYVDRHGVVVEPDEAELAVQAKIADRLRDALVSMKDVRRADALAAALIVVGSEGGYEQAGSKERFLTYCRHVLSWAWDLGADVKKHKGEAS